MKRLYTFLFLLFSLSYSHAQNYRWAYGFGGPNYDAQGTSIATDAQANVYVAGFYGDSIDFDPGPGTALLVPYNFPNSQSMFIAKYDSAGSFIWAINLAGFSNFGTPSLAVNATGLYVTGTFGGTTDFDPSATVANLTATGADMFLAKYDLNGNYQWAIRAGNTQQTITNSIAIDNIGNSYLTGSFKDTVDFDSGVGIHNLISNGIQDVFFAKYDSSGNYVWAHSIGDVSYYCSGSRIILNKAENFIYVSGYFKGSPDFDPGAGTLIITAVGAGDDFIARYDTSGNFVWAGAISSTFTTGGLIGDITSFTRNGTEYLYVTGLFRNVTDFDLSSNVYNLNSSGPSGDLFFAEYDNSGNLIWIKTIPSTTLGGGIRGSSLKIGKDAALFLCGYYAGTTDFDPGAGIANLSNNGSSDMFFAKYDSSGNYVWARGMGGQYTDQPTCIALDSNDNQYLTGYFQWSMDCDPGTGVVTLFPGGGNQNIFIGKYISIPTGIFNQFQNTSLNLFVYPNPASDKITISGTTINQPFELRILDLTGRIVFEKFTEDRTFDISSLRPGVYFVEIKLSDKNYRTHFIKE